MSRRSVRKERRCWRQRRRRHGGLVMAVQLPQVNIENVLPARTASIIRTQAHARSAYEYQNSHTQKHCMLMGSSPNSFDSNTQCKSRILTHTHTQSFTGSHSVAVKFIQYSPYHLSANALIFSMYAGRRGRPDWIWFVLPHRFALHAARRADTVRMGLGDARSGGV